ncbi:MAG: hypothetical protein ACRDJH_26895 [Thermomicrobiales bacterium]
MGRYSSFLYADPSFTEGMARIFDFGDTLTEYNRSMSEGQADAIAMEADWNAVIDDFATAFAKVGEQIGATELDDHFSTSR